MIFDSIVHLNIITFCKIAQNDGVAFSWQVFCTKFRCQHLLVASLSNSRSLHILILCKITQKDWEAKQLTNFPYQIEMDIMLALPGGQFVKLTNTDVINFVQIT